MSRNPCKTLPRPPRPRGAKETSGPSRQASHPTPTPLQPKVHASANTPPGILSTWVCRDRDANTSWASATDNVREERRYYCQNWRADVSALLTDTGKMVEWVKHSAHGTAMGIPAGDTNSRGEWN